MKIEAEQILQWFESGSQPNAQPEIMKLLTVKVLIDGCSKEYIPWGNLLTSFLKKFNINRADVEQDLVYDLLNNRKEVPESLKSKADWGIIPSEEIPKQWPTAQENWLPPVQEFQAAQKRLWSYAALEYSLKADYSGMFSRLMGGIKPIIYVLDDYNNYIECQNELYRPKSYLLEKTVEYYQENKDLTQKKWEEALQGFCITLNNLSLVFDVKAPPLWIAKTQASYELIVAAIPLEKINKERSQIAAFIIDLEWLPTITNYDWSGLDRKQWQKMGRFAIKILSQFYPEIPAFIFTGLQPAEELQDGLSYGAFWGFQKEKTHHYSEEPKKIKQLPEKLTSISLERQLTRAVEVKYGSFQEVPFPNQLNLDPSTANGKKLIQRLQIQQPIGNSPQSLTLKRLIAGLLPNATSVEPTKVITTGKSKAEATFFVSPTAGEDKLATRFIKIGSWFSIQKEYLAYQKVIQPRLNSYTANVIDKPVLAARENNQMPKGALMYSLAGFPEDYQSLRSLHELVEEQIEKPEGAVFLCDRLQNTLKQVLFPLYQSGISKSKNQPLWCWLGDVLPPLYTGVLIPLTLTSLESLDETKASIVIASKTAQGYKNTAAWTLASFDLIQLDSQLEKQKQDCQKTGVLEQPSHWDEEILLKPYKQVLLSGWHLSAIEWQESDLGDGSITLVHPDLGMRILLRGRSEDIRLRFGATWIRPGMPVKLLACLDTNNQELERIRKKIAQNISHLNCLSDANNNPASDILGAILNEFGEKSGLKNQQLISPFQVFGRDSILPCHYTISARAGAIHGDLNLNNILYPANETVGWLIDFELVKEQGMIAFDLAKLEVEIWNHHLSPYLALIATLSNSDRISSCYQLLYWCLQALDFPGDEKEFFLIKIKSSKEFPFIVSDRLIMPVNHTLKALKTLRIFGLEKCHLTQNEIKWALAAYFFNSVKFQSTSKLNEFSGYSPIFAFLASAYHLNGLLPKVKIS